MADNIKGIPFSTDDEGTSYPDIAKHAVRTVTDGEVYIVWFAYVLGGWKALCSTDLPDGRYYEVTYNPESHVIYLDTYIKIEHKALTVPRVPPAGMH